MAIAITTVELEKNNIVANVPINCAMPVFEEDHIFVYYCDIRAVAVQGVDYTIALNDITYDDFIITPTASLLTKINDQIALDPTDQNVIFVRRSVPLTNDLQETDAFFRAKLTDEVDRLTMTDQQLDERLGNIEFIGEDAAAIIAAKDEAVAAAAAALISENNAASSESNAATSETNAAGSAATATTQAGIATGAAGTATTQAGIATTQAGIATAAANETAALYDNFDDRYLGEKSSNPALDNDGDPLIEGAIYWNSVAKEMRTWDGTQWVLTLAALGYATEGYADSVANDALNDAKAYTDVEIADAIATSAGYTDAEIATLETIVNAKADKTIQITGTGLLSGGGDLSANRTLEVTVATQSQAEAGVDNNTAITPLRLKQGINTMGVSAVSGVQMAMELADLRNSVFFLGPAGSGAFDSFDTTTYLDLVNSINLDTSVPGIIKPTSTPGPDQIPTMTAATTSGVTMSALTTDPQGGGALYPPWKAGDKASYATYAYGSAAGTSGWLKVDFGAGNTRTIGSYMLRASSIPLRMPYVWSLEGSNDNTIWTALDTRNNVTFSSTQSRTYPVASPTAYRYYRINWSSVQPGNDGYSGIGQLALYSLGSTLIPQATGTNIGSMTAGNGIASAFDANIATYAQTTAQMIAGYVGKTYTGTPKRIAQAIVKPPSTGYDGTASTANITLTLYGKQGSAPANATDGTSLATTTFQETGGGSGGNRTLISGDQNTLWDHVWVRAIDDIDICRMAEIEFYEPTGADALTAISAVYTAASAPTKIKGFLTLKPLEAVTLNTDVFVDYSRNNGATWTQAVLTDIYTDPLDGFHLLQTDEVDVSAQSSDVQVKYRVRLPTSKRAEVGDKAIYWR